MFRDPRRRLIFALRRRVRVTQTFDVAPDPKDDRTEVQTCRECGHVERHTYPKAAPAAIQRLIAYRARGGVTGVCKVCSRKEAEKRYPL